MGRCGANPGLNYAESVYKVCCSFILDVYLFLSLGLLLARIVQVFDTNVEVVWLEGEYDKSWKVAPLWLTLEQQGNGTTYCTLHTYKTSNTRERPMACQHPAN